MPSVAFNKQSDVTDVALSADGKTASLDLWYPRQPGRAEFVEIGLMDVRASDGLRISYDFERGGWKIEQASVFEWECEDSVQDEGWSEVAFVESWARQSVPPRDEDGNAFPD